MCSWVGELETEREAMAVGSKLEGTNGGEEARIVPGGVEYFKEVQIRNNRKNFRD